MTSPTVSVPQRMPGIRGQKGASRSDGVSSISGIPVALPARSVRTGGSASAPGGSR